MHRGFHKCFSAFSRFFWRSFLIMATFLLVLLSIKFFAVDAGVVEGPSMEPNFVDNETFLISKFTYFVRSPQRYDVIQLLDFGNKSLIIKRVIGLPNETIVIKRGHVYIKNNESVGEIRLFEPYLSSSVYTSVMGQKDVMSFTVPPDSYFVLGDNRLKSVDSRLFGFIHRSRIVGFVMAKLF